VTPLSWECCGHWASEVLALSKRLHEEGNRLKRYRAPVGDGRPSGDPEDHWLRAEQELKGVASRDGDDLEAKPSGDKIIDKLGDFA
jgi:hypothetical protein